MQKLYCFVDESGQETRGALFLAAIVVTNNDYEAEIALLTQLEQKSGKGKEKWSRSDYKQRLAFVQALLAEPLFKGKLYFAIYEQTIDYKMLTGKTIALVLKTHATGEYNATVIVDGMNKVQCRAFGTLLRKQWEIKVNKVKGANDANNSLIRLADTHAGFARDGLAGQKSFQPLLETALKEGYIVYLK